MRRFHLGLLCFLAISSAVACGQEDSPEPSPENPKKAASPEKASKPKGPPPKKELYVGKVVMLRPALKSKDVTAYDEFDKMVALQTESGELIPIIPDWRGRAFYQDKRLRDRKLNVIGYRRKGIPFLQVLMIFVFDKEGKRQYMDYWCDICSIPMYEIKPCDCCQDPIRIRFQPRPLPKYIKLKDVKPSTKKK